MFKYLDIGNESLGYQGKDFFLALQHVIQQARLSKDDRATVLRNLAIDIDKTIAEYLNATTITRWDSSVSAGYVCVRVNTRQHIAFARERGEQEKNYMYNNRTLEQVVTSIGYVDAATGKLGGTFAKVRNYMTLNPNAIMKWDIEEAAAMVIHESGHIYANAFFEGVLHGRSVALDWMYKELVGQTDAIKVKKLVVTTRQAMGLDTTKVVMEDVSNPEKTFVIAASDITRDMIEDDPLSPFSYDAAEQMADAFAVRHGAGRAILSNRLRSYRDTRRRGYGDIRNASMAAGMFALMSIAIAPASLFGIYYLGKALTLYGMKMLDPKVNTVQQIFGNIVKEMVQSLKEGELTKEDRAMLIDDIEEGYAALEQARKSEFDASRATWGFINDIFSDRNRVNEFNERLQGLSANRLFVDAAKLSK